MTDRKTDPLRKINGMLLLALGAFLCLTGFLICYVVCIDRVAEFMRGADSYNNWVPFHGNGLEWVKQIPRALWISFQYFTMASFITLVFFPLLAVLVPPYDLFVYGDPGALLYGWGPFLTGIGMLIFGGLYLERS